MKKRCSESSTERRLLSISFFIPDNTSCHSATACSFASVLANHFCLISRGAPAFSGGSGYVARESFFREIIQSGKTTPVIAVQPDPGQDNLKL